MGQILTIRILLLGLACWALPFLASFAFYDRTGNLQVDIFLFKSIMIVFGGLVGAWLLLAAFRRIEPGFSSGLILGLTWFALNCVLDLAVLVAAMGVGAGEWLTGIGLRYLMIPIMAAAMGSLAARQVK